MNELDSSELFTQIRTAHRMVVAYYKRLFPILQGTADLLGLDFYCWVSGRFSPPGQRSTNILSGGAWEWDLTPGIMPIFLFHNAEDNKIQLPGQWMLSLSVITDTGVLTENMGSNMDSLDLTISPEQAESLLRVSIVVPTKKTSLSWLDHVWRSCENIELNRSLEKSLIDEKNGIYAIGFEVPLSKLVEKNASDWLKSEIITLRTELLSEIGSQNLI
tara:strand:- start:6766 stop:7416 length:651 start_codon:yes stop_codon:yes gene_type:complete